MAADQRAPKAFVSYAWTNEEYAERVLALASRLRSDGVDVIIDKWDLQPGHDANAFMESMVTDSTLDKVIIVSNPVYVLKANSRSGGVGTEAQIISPEIYGKAGQSKFVAVIFERENDGNTSVPVFYKGRIHIDLSDDSMYESEYDRLLRWLHGNPLHVRPPLGATPSYLQAGTQDGISTYSDFTRALKSIKDGRNNSAAFLRDFRDRFKEALERLRIKSNGANDFDDVIIQSLNESKPFISEFQQLTIAAARSREFDELLEEFALILEDAQGFTRPSKALNQYYEWDFDNFRFVAYELILVFFAVLIKEGRFKEFKTLTDRQFYIKNNGNNAASTEDYTAYNHHLPSLAHRNQRLSLNRVSVLSDLMKERYTAGAVTFDDIIYADLIAFLRDAVIALNSAEGFVPSWYPQTLGYLDVWTPIPLFAKSESRKFAAGVATLLGIGGVEKIKPTLQKISDNNWLPKRGYFGIDLKRVTNFDRLCMYG
jgi:hypothetical protein